MHTVTIPPADPAPATITAALAIHAGHIGPSSFRVLLFYVGCAANTRPDVIRPRTLQRCIRSHNGVILTLRIAKQKDLRLFLRCHQERRGPHNLA
jgi:hypothetical protein